jgi:hypothetical protein
LGQNFRHPEIPDSLFWLASPESLALPSSALPYFAIGCYRESNPDHNSMCLILCVIYFAHYHKEDDTIGE